MTGKRGLTGKHGNHRRGPVAPRLQLVCLGCRNAFVVTPRGAGRSFCSAACRDSSRKVQKPCGVCGASMRSSRRKFCSKACASSARRVSGAKWRDPNQIRAYMRAYVAANRDAHNARSRAWAANNRDNRNENRRTQAGPHPP